MTIHFDALSIITALGMAQGLFLSLAIWGVASPNQKANRVLAVTILLLAFSISHGILTYTNLYFFLPHLLLTALPLSFTFGPLCLLYFKYLTIPSYRIQKREYWYFLPFLVSVAVLMPFYLKTGPEKLALLKDFLESKKLYPPSQVLGIIAQIHMWIYLYVIWQKVNTYQRSIKDSFSKIDKINLSWIKHFVWLYVAAFVLLIPLTVLRLTGNLNLELERMIPLVVALNFYYLGYKGFHQAAVFAPIDLERANGLQIKHEKTTLDKELAHYYQKELIELMENEKLYQDSDLTLNDLARELAINRNLLSRIINEQLGQNFYDFVNSYRVKEVQEKLRQNFSGASLLQIAMDAGFNSKATFNAVFKKATDMTPSAFKKAHSSGA